ncbi:hypothetical protein AM493_01770 [Flavobacterium akiainvivens]|uniref:Bacterial membrane protein YfhO n=1 Tax=Flavobacterium akiainvivens TaxID=1202724 RepID=A0A0M9VJU9_9FLAO|nr:YfhO family protein [Flavobacterium akiainvivens]KOS08166.1 hypothetical protein AM493_01770 [Flavobacterium akiainvivens]
MKNINRILPQLLAIGGFIVVALIYFYPVLQGKQLFQSDIAQYTGMAKEMNDFRKDTGEEPYWTNNAFGGMPTYQMGAKYPHNYIKQLDSVIRFLPRPADYLFLYFLGFFVLLRVLKIDTLKAFFGALAFGFSTYMIVILGAGHNAKAHAIGYMPLIVAGIILVFRKRYVVGGLLTLVATALEIQANHFQMTYYLLFLLLILGIYYVVKIAKQKDYKHLGTSVGVFAVAGLVALGLNAGSLMATAEYTPFSNRGKSELSFNQDGKQSSDASMEYSYITEYSYGVAESFDLISPRLFGGGNRENVGEDSHMYNFISELGASPSEAAEFAANVPTYWGDQPIVEAPAYIGAIVFFLAVFALFADTRKLKYVFLGGAVLSLMLSWGKNFDPLTSFFINYVPLYDKFRAVSSIQVILELCMPALAFMGLQTFFKTEKDKQFKYLWQSAAVVLGIFVALMVLKGSFSFTGLRDEEYRKGYGEMGNSFVDALRQQRMDMYMADLWRSILLVAAAAGVLFAASRQKLSEMAAVIVLGVLLVGDLYFVDRNYVNAEDFVGAIKMEKPFDATVADEIVRRDEGHFRVYEPQGRLQGRASYFHQSVGGYSAVRPRRMDQLFTHNIEKNFDKIDIDPQTGLLKKPVPVLDLLNVKYMLLGEEQPPVTNPFANGPAWFVSSVKPVNTPDEEFKALDNLNSRDVAVVNKEKFGKDIAKTSFVKDSAATIKLESYEPNHLVYNTNNTNDGLAVFSEMYYPYGWNTYIDGKPATHFQADYVLRAMNVPAGKHKIEFKFEPQVVKTGGTISLISFVVLLGLIGAGVWYEAPRPPKGEKAQAPNLKG